MSYPILFQPRWFSPLLKENVMWRLNSSKNSTGDICVSGTKPFVVLTDQSHHLITRLSMDRWKTRIEKMFPTKSINFPFDLSGYISADDIAFLQSDFAGITESEKTLDIPNIGINHLGSSQTENTTGAMGNTAQDNARDLREENTFWEAFAQMMINPPFGHRDGVVAFCTRKNDSLRMAADRFLAFLDALRIDWTHVVSFGNESLLSTYLALHHPHRIGSLVIMDTPILPEYYQKTDESHTRENQNDEIYLSSNTHDRSMLEEFLNEFPSKEHLQLMLHPILFITTEDKPSTAECVVNHHKQFFNLKKSIKLKEIAGDVWRELISGKRTFSSNSKRSDSFQMLCTAMLKWHERFDLQSYVNRRWESARALYETHAGKQEQ